MTASFALRFDGYFSYKLKRNTLFFSVRPRGPKLPSNPCNGKSLQASKRCDHTHTHTHSREKQPNETTEPDIKSHGVITHQQQLNESTEAEHTHSVSVVCCKNQAGIGLAVIQSDLSPHCEMISNRGLLLRDTGVNKTHTPTLLPHTSRLYRQSTKKSDK